LHKQVPCINPHHHGIILVYTRDMLYPCRVGVVVCKPMASICMHIVLEHLFMFTHRPPRYRLRRLPSRPDRLQQLGHVGMLIFVKYNIVHNLTNCGVWEYRTRVRSMGCSHLQGLSQTHYRGSGRPLRVGYRSRLLSRLRFLTHD
jgi:hypothetical protein